LLPSPDQRLVSGNLPTDRVLLLVERLLLGASDVTPAMAAGVTDRLWSVDDIAALVEVAEPVPAKRGPYKKRAA